MPKEQSGGKPTTHRYSLEERAQAVRLVRQLRRELGTSQGTVARVAEQLLTTRVVGMVVVDDAILLLVLANDRCWKRRGWPESRWAATIASVSWRRSPCAVTRMTPLVRPLTGDCGVRR